MGSLSHKINNKQGYLKALEIDKFKIKWTDLLIKFATSCHLMAVGHLSDTTQVNWRRPSSSQSLKDHSNSYSIDQSIVGLLGYAPLYHFPEIA
jgi:hypothetical protein